MLNPSLCSRIHSAETGIDREGSIFVLIVMSFVNFPLPQVDKFEMFMCVRDLIVDSVGEGRGKFEITSKRRGHSLSAFKIQRKINSSCLNVTYEAQTSSNEQR